MSFHDQIWVYNILQQVMLLIIINGENKRRLVREYSREQVCNPKQLMCCSKILLKIENFQMITFLKFQWKTQI